MSNITTTSMNVGSFLDRGLAKFDATSSSLEAKMQALTAEGAEIKQADMIKLQYEMGQYQASLTMLSNTISSIQSHTKELANSIR